MNSINNGCHTTIYEVCEVSYLFLIPYSRFLIAHTIYLLPTYLFLIITQVVGYHPYKVIPTVTLTVTF